MSELIKEVKHVFALLTEEHCLRLGDAVVLREEAVLWRLNRLDSDWLATEYMCRKPNWV